MFQSVFFTDRRKVSDCKKVIKNLPKNSVVIIREYDLPKSEREVFAREISAVAKERGLKILVGKDIGLAKKIKADGVHFSDFDRIPLALIRKENLVFSFSCHDLKSVLRARKTRPDMVFVSPIFPTTSHKETKSIGLLNFAKIIKISKNSLPIYALGGVNPLNLKSLLKLKISGFGAIDYFVKS